MKHHVDRISVCVVLSVVSLREWQGKEGTGGGDAVEGCACTKATEVTIQCVV